MVKRRVGRPTRYISTDSQPEPTGSHQKITESPEIVHQVVADEISTHYDGELTKIEDDEGIFVLSEQPENIDELESELLSRFPSGNISLIVLGSPAEEYEDVHIRIADAVVDPNNI